jgi:predicted exporter
VVGLIGSWLTVMLLFPYVFQKLPPESAFNRMFPKWWLRLKQAKLPIMYHKISTVLLLILVIFGLSRTSFKDDLRAFQNSPNWLMQEQVKAGKLLGESNTQYFLVTANNEQALLESEEALRDQLDALNTEGQTFHYRAISEWVPSILRQQANLTLVTDKVAAIAPKIGMDIPAVTSSQISMDSWLAQPFSGTLKNQWLGQQADGRWASVVSLTGEVTEKNKQAFASLAKNQPTVLWIDQVENYNQIMQLYRNKMLWMLALAYLVVAACLWPRYRRKSLWVLAAPALASVLTVALLGLLHIPLQLFTVLPLLLILGMGVDYGIFLVEHAKEQQNLWMTVCLSAWSTILSLGTLTLSSTPALHNLGLSLAVGMSATWLAIVFISNWMTSEAA